VVSAGGDNGNGQRFVHTTPKPVPQAADLHERARDVSRAGKVNPLLDSDKAREVVAADLDMATTQVHVVIDAAKADQILAAAVTAGAQLPATLVDAPRRKTRASIALLSDEDRRVTCLVLAARSLAKL